MLVGADYSHFKRFTFLPGEEPDYLKTEYGIDSKGGANVGKLIREDFQFVDSNLVAGIQVADLLSSGLRRLLRGGFEAPDRVATLIGSNMLQETNRDAPVKLITFDQAGCASPRTARLIRLIASHSRSMLTPST